jgi:hypothetical protein
MYAAKEWSNSTNIRQIFMNGRHYNISFILTLQFSLGIPPALRGQADYVFMFSEGRSKELRKLHEHWASIITTFKLFKTIMDNFTDNYGCVVIDVNAPTKKIEDNIFWYNAKEHGPFKLGTPEVWSWSDRLSQSRSEKINNKQYKNIKII